MVSSILCTRFAAYSVIFPSRSVFLYLFAGLVFCSHWLSSVFCYFLILQPLKHSSFCPSCLFCVVCCSSLYSLMSDQCFQLFAVDENWSVTFLFFYSGNLSWLLYFAASTCWSSFIYSFPLHPLKSQKTILFTHASSVLTYSFCAWLSGIRPSTAFSFWCSRLKIARTLLSRKFKKHPGSVQQLKKHPTPLWALNRLDLNLYLDL